MPCRDPNRLSQTITFDTLNSAQDLQNMPFSVRLQLVKNGPIVSLHLPALNFQLPLDGGTLTTIAGFLPKKWTPVDPVFQSSTLEADQTGTGYDLYITNEGGLRVVGKGNAIIPGGPQVTHAKTIEYFVAETFKSRCPARSSAPKNFRVSNGLSQATKFTGAALTIQFLDFYTNSIFDDRMIFCWADNAGVTTPPYKFDIAVRVGDLKHGKLHLHEQKLLTDFPLNVFAAENSASINPTDKDNIVVTSNVIFLSNPPGATEHQLYRGVTFDGGDNWSVGRVDNMGTLPFAHDDSQGKFDKFGGHWLLYITQFAGNAQLVIAHSPDGGLTYSLVYLSTDGGTFPFGYDYPQFTFGGDGQGGYGLWFTVQFVVLNPLAPFGADFTQEVGFISITGKNDFSTTPTIVRLTSIINQFTVPNIAASDDGKVFLYGSRLSFDPNVNGDSRCEIGMVVFPTGLVNFADGQFLGPWLVALPNNSITSGAPQSQPIFSQVRTVNPNTPDAVIYDNERQLLYVIVNDMIPAYSQNMTIYMLISSNLGQTWSDPIQISDLTIGNRGLISFAQDRITGNLAYSFYDARRDPTNESVDYFGTILTAKQLDKRIKQLEIGSFGGVVPSLNVASKMAHQNTPATKKLVKTRYDRHHHD